MAGKGREVADAYIQVHGDLSPFRSDLRKATKAGQEAGREAADGFAEGWEARSKDQLMGRWDSIIDALHSGKKVDWDKALGKFDPNSMRDAQNEMNDLIDFMAEGGEQAKITGGQVTWMKKQIDNHIKTLEDFKKAQDSSTRAMEESKAAAQRYAKSLTGMREAAKFKELEKDFERLAAAMETNNWSELGKGHMGFDTLRKRIDEVTVAMQKTGRVSDTELESINRAVSHVGSNMKRFGLDLDQTTRKFRPLRFAMDKIKLSWARMDSTVRMVVGLIASAASPMATLGSGLAGAGTAIASSLATAATSAVPLASAFAGVGVAVGLAVASMDTMKAQFPGIITGAQAVGDAWQEQATRFGQMWGPALERFLGAFAGALARFDFGTPMGKAMASITAGFTEVVEGPAFTALMSAMATTLPGAVASLGEGFAHVFNILSSLLAGAAPVAKLLADDFLRWAGNINKVVEEARKSGVMNEIFMQARESLLAVLDLAGSVGNMLGTIFVLGADSGNRMLGALTGIVDQFTAWMNTDAGREAMLTWFSNAERIMGSLKPVLIGLGEALAVLVTPETITQFENLMSSVGQLLPLLGEILATVSELGVLNILATALVAVGQAIQPMLPGLGQLLSAIGPNLQGAIQALTPLLSSIGSALGAVFAAIAPVVGQVLGALIPAFQQISTALAPIIEVVGQVVATIVSVLAPILGSFLIGIINNVVGVVQGFATVVQGVVQTITAVLNGDWRGAWEGIKTIVQGAVQAIWNLVQLWIVGKLFGFLKAFGPQIGALFRAGWQAVMTVTTAVWTAIAGFIGLVLAAIATTITAAMSAIGSFFSTVWNGLLTIVTTVFTAIWDFISVIWQTIVTGITMYLTMLQTVWSTVWSAVSLVVTTAWNAISTVITTVLSAIWGFIQPILTAIGELFSAIWSAIVGVVTISNQLMQQGITSVWNAIWGVIGPIVTRIQVWIITAWNLIKSATTVAFNAVKSHLTTVWTTLVSTITGWVNDIKSKITVTWNAIKSTTSTVFNSIKAFFTTVWNAIKSYVTTTVNTLKSTISTQWNSIKATTSAVFNAIKSYLSTIWSTIKTTVQNAVNNVKTFVSTGFQAVKNKTVEIWNGIISWIRGIPSRFLSAINGISALAGKIGGYVSQAKSAVVSRFNEVVSWVGGIPGRILSALGNMGGLLTGAGQAIIDGLLGGLQASWGKVTSFVGGIADWIRNNKGPLPYDRVLLIPAGNAIMEGLRNGLEQMIPHLKSTLQTVTSSITDGIGDRVDEVGAAASKLADAVTSRFDTSKMRIAGQDAAQGLADGLKASKSAISAAYSALSTPGMSTKVEAAGRIVGRPTLSAQQAPAAPAHSVNIEAGAIQVNTASKKPETAAGIMLDELAAFTTKMG